MKNFAFTIYKFKEINPEKKYSYFTFTEMRFEEINVGYCNKDEILRIDGKYYLYAGDSMLIDSEKQPAQILFLKGKKTVKAITVK